jgi:hypothetical protein
MLETLQPFARESAANATTQVQVRIALTIEPRKLDNNSLKVYIVPLFRIQAGISFGQLKESQLN